MVPSVCTGEMLTLCVCVCVCERESQCCLHFINFCLVATVAVGQRTSVVSPVTSAFLEQRNCIFSVYLQIVFEPCRLTGNTQVVPCKENET